MYNGLSGLPLMAMLFRCTNYTVLVTRLYRKIISYFVSNMQAIVPLSFINRLFTSNLGTV